MRIEQNVNSFLAAQPNEDIFDREPYDQAPKAFVCVMFFDERFEFDKDHSFVEMVAYSPNTKGTIDRTFSNALEVPKNGYALVYFSNESDELAYFDNFSLSHERGPILEETHYYPFGLTMAGVSSKSAGSLTSNYKFGGKELSSNDFSDGSGLELYDFHARNYDPQVGRVWSGDPKADKLVQWSQYSYAVNNSILSVDPDGEFPYPVHIRSFALFKTFGGSFSGDNRGYSTAAGKGEGGSATSRVQQTFTVDPSKGELTGQRTWSDATHHPLRESQTATPTGNVDVTYGCSPEKNSATINSTMAGANPLVPGSPDIDVKSSLTIVEDLKAGTLTVNATMKGDGFPAAEMFIGDTKGTQLMVIASPYEGNPFGLIGDGNKAMGSANFTVTINDKGEFTGVVVGSGKDAKTYSVADWNKQRQSTPLEKKPTGTPVNYPTRGGGFVF